MSAQGPAEGADIVGEQVGDLHGGEVAATVEFRPVLDRAERIHQAPDRAVRGEDSDPGRRTGLLWMPLLCLARLLLGGEGLYLGLLDADFRVDGSVAPELAESLRTLSTRYARAIS